MRCPDHCPAPGGLPWSWILLVLALVVFAAGMTWLAVTVGKGWMLSVSAVLAVVVLGMITLFVINAIENTLKARKDLRWPSTPRAAMSRTPAVAELLSPAADPVPLVLPVSSPATRRLTLISGGLDDDGTGERVA